jgi:predicted small metal-binding protein
MDKDESKRVLNDCVSLLKCAHDVYMIREDNIVQNQIKVVAENIKRAYVEDKISVKTIETIKLYINNLLTDDESIIVPEGKVLLEILK